MNLISNWFQRHQHPGSLLLHAIGIPLTVVALVLVIVQLGQGRWDLWWRPVVCVVLGYALQYLGHRIEGNDMGEMILFKRLMGKPYIAVAPSREGRVKSEGRRAK